MGLFDPMKSAGRAFGIGPADAADARAPPAAEALKPEVTANKLKVEGLAVEVVGDKVVLSGKAATVEDKEEAILAVGNVAGAAQVEDKIETAKPAHPSGFDTVEKGDTLSAIAQAHYGNTSRYPLIFEANKPSLKHPDKITSGQVPRIPPLPEAA